MKFGITIFLALGLILPLYSQYSDNFSDGNLDNWQGDVVNFVINAEQQLQLNAPAGSTSSWIYTPVTYTDSMVWEFYFKLDFAPSTSNQLKIYLGVNSSDLSSASGYYLEIGASGDQDALELKYLNNGISESIATSAPGLVGLEPVVLTIRITKKSNGVWQCFKLGEVVPELLFTTTHDLLPLTGLNLFGFNGKYSDTRRDKFYFDDISIQPVLADIIAPTCTSVSVLDANSVRLEFDEVLDQNSMLTFNHYLLSPGNTNPTIIEPGQQGVTLRWAQSFISQQPYTLAIQDIKDVAGNIMVPDNKAFTFIQIDKALPFEMLITEIMADPTPVIGLPDGEYLEIFNTSSKVFRLSDYKIQIGSGERSFPDELILGGEYVILCNEANAVLLAGFGRTVIISTMPTLTNSGSTVTLKDNSDLIIHDVSYTIDWYGNPAKSSGGWSLEMINPLHICSDQENWNAAQNLVGGTPGKINSSWSTLPDQTGPELMSLFVSSPDKILLRFNERLDAILMENPNAYSVLPEISISSAVLQDPATVELTLSQSLEDGVVYQFLPFDAFDCLGNSLPYADTIRFGLTADAEKGDILINELLFNPATGGSRFIEIINVSEKFINLNTLAIGRISAEHNDLFPTGIDEIIGPGELAVFTPEPSDISFRYVVPQPSRLYDATLPSWDDQSDHAAIISGGIFLDSFTYSSTWHLPVIADQNGVSLERISSTAATSSSSSWHSASSVSGYATPTGQNSQMVLQPSPAETPFTVTNRQFSPNEDGYKDFLALNFLLTSGDNIGSVWIYDLEGREINELINNESLGTSAIVQWDGRTADQTLADMGIYIIFIQLWDAMGSVKEYQETCALVKR